MKSGRFVEIGTPHELYTHPRTIFGANFVGEANFLEGTIVKSSNYASIIDCGGGLILESSENSRAVGERVVAAIRPESVSLEKKQVQDGVYGYVETEDFEGCTVHYEVTLPNHGLFAVRVSLGSISRIFSVGDELALAIPPERVLLYPYPEEGLQTELDLESKSQRAL